MTTAASTPSRRPRITRARSAPARRGRGAEHDDKNKRKSKIKNGPRDQSRDKGRVKIRMYRQGLGDCFLLSLPRKNGTTFHLMIDCGVILGTEDAAKIMTDVVNNIAEVTGGEIDLLVGTHLHWDHLSGFIQAKDVFEKKIKVHQVWLGWTENPDDSQANKLGRERDQALAALESSVAQMHLAGASEAADEISGILSFFGAARGGASTKEALQRLREMGKGNVRYCQPGDPPTSLPDTGATVYVLGPPRNEKMLAETLPLTKNPETYGLATAAAAIDATLDMDDTGRPFDTQRSIPFTVASELPFFKDRYFRPGTSDLDWRKIDTAWFDGASELALRLDSVTNNTSLALAIELDDTEILLFAADAQVGNWLSWQDVKWPDGPTGPDLLKRTIFYKVGHHGSHNATLREKGLDLMERLQVAMIPVNHDMAVRKHWVKDALDRTRHRVK
jgi:hypothetical protein